MTILKNVYYCPLCNAKMHDNGNVYNKRLALSVKRYRCSNTKCGKTYMNHILDTITHGVTMCINCHQPYDPAQSIDVNSPTVS